MDRIEEAATETGSSGRPAGVEGSVDDGFAAPLDPHETIDVVGRRFDFLTALSAGPKQKPVLQTELEVSRSTVYKAIRELENRRLVSRGNDGYRLSVLGRLFLEEYDRFRSNVRTVCEKGPLLAELEADCGVSIDLLSGAEVVYAERHAPLHPVRTTESMVDAADTLRGISSIVLPGYVDAFSEQLHADTLEAELIFSRPAVEWLSTHETERFRAALRSTAFTVSATGAWLPFGLIVSDDPEPQVALFVHDERGDLRGLIVNDSTDALEWGQRIWQRYRNRATELDESVIADVD